jgi:isoprenylcysteine carboxyl methyltransferase (ICMT) family protein YpbQ
MAVITPDNFFFTLRPRDTVTASTQKEKTEKESAGFIFCCSLFLFHDDYVLSIKKDSPTPVSFLFFFFFLLCLFWSFFPLLHRWRRKSQVKPSMDVSRMGWFKLHSHLNYFTSCHLGFTDMLIAINQVASLFPFFLMIVAIFLPLPCWIYEVLPFTHND